MAPLHGIEELLYILSLSGPGLLVGSIILILFFRRWGRFHWLSTIVLVFIWQIISTYTFWFGIFPSRSLDSSWLLITIPFAITLIAMLILTVIIKKLFWR